MGLEVRRAATLSPCSRKGYKIEEGSWRHEEGGILKQDPKMFLDNDVSGGHRGGDCSMLVYFNTISGGLQNWDK